MFEVITELYVNYQLDYEGNTGHKIDINAFNATKEPYRRKAHDYKGRCAPKIH